MEKMSTKSRGPEQLDQESFSFSSFDFNSSIGIFSDDDDEHENDEAYIEIALEQEQDQTQPNSTTQGRGDYGNDDLEFLRVSFSSSVPFPGFSCSSENDNTACSSSMITTTSTFCSSSANTESTTQTETGGLGAEVLSVNGRSNIGGRVGFPAVNGLVDALLSALKLKGSSSAVLLGNQNGTANKGNWGLVRSRKAPSKGNGGARKLLIKFRSINILSMMASFVKPKPRQVITSSKINNNNNIRTTISHDEAITLQTHTMPSNSHRNVEATKSPNLRRKNGENSRLLEINFEAITRMVEAVSKNIIGARGKTKQSKSCPGSIKSSPIHDQERQIPSENKIYGRENSVQAAIAHCKQSFGQNR